MVPVFIVKVAEIAIGLVVGNAASNALDKVVVEVKKAVESKKKGDAQK